MATPTNFKDLGLFSGASQVEHFSKLHQLLPVRQISAPTTSSEFPVPADQFRLPETYTFQGTAHSTDRFLDDTDTSALLVIHNGSLVFERYFKTGGQQVPWLSMSVAKSVVSALVGIALDEGLISSIEDPISNYIPVDPGSAYDGVAICNVLQMSSGARWNEEYSDPNSDAPRLAAAMQHSPGLSGFVASMQKEVEPGRLCRYNSGDTQALGLLLHHVTQGAVSDFTRSRLFEPLGIEHGAYWLVDPDGVEAVFAGLLLSARDYAKLGELYRNMGRYAGRQIVSEQWVEDSTRPLAEHAGYGKVVLGSSYTGFGYGYQWWLTDAAAPQEFSAIGVYNQFVYVDRARNAVVVKLSANPRYGLSEDERDNRDLENIAFIKDVIAAL